MNGASPIQVINQSELKIDVNLSKFKFQTKVMSSDLDHIPVGGRIQYSVEAWMSFTQGP